MKLIKLSSFYVFLVTMTLILSCSNDKKNPVSSNNPDPEATATIGSEGGSIGTEAITISVPSGAFQTSENLAIAVVPDNEGIFGPDTSNDMYYISGLPNDIDLPLHVIIKYNGEITGDPKIALGWYEQNIDQMDTLKLYQYIDAEDSSGYLVADIIPKRPSSNQLAKLFGDPDGIDIFDIFIMKTLLDDKEYKTEHFKIHCPVFYFTQIPSIANILETNLSYITDQLNFQFFNYNWVKPINTKFYKMLKSNKVNCNWINTSEFEGIYPDIKDVPEVDINLELLKGGKYDDIDIASRIGMLDLFLSDNNRSIYDPTSSDLWFQKSILTWFESYISPDEYDVPGGFPGQEWAPFNGLAAGMNISNSDKSAEYLLRRNHAYGMSSLVEFLTGNSELYGLQKLAPTFLSATETHNMFEALLLNVNALVTQWLPDFFQEYISGNIYNVAHTVFTNSENLSGSWSINTQNDTSKVFSQSFPDLSAKCYMVNVNYEDLDEDQDLIIDVNGDVSDDGLVTLAFAVHSTYLEYLGRSSASEGNMMINRLKANAEGGINQYLFVVVNCTHNDLFTGSSNIDVIMSLPQKQESPDFTNCSFVFYMDNSYTECNTTTGICETIVQNVPSFWASDTGSTENFKYSGSGYSGGVLHSSSTITCTFSKDLSKILTLEWIRTEYRDTHNFTSEVHIIANNIPIDWKNSTTYQYKLSGESVCSSVTTFTYDRTWDNGYSSITSRECNSKSNITVAFWKGE